MASVFTQTDCSSGNFVVVCNGKTGASKECFELQLDRNKNLALETLHVQFPEVLAIKYKNPESGMMRILKAEKSVIAQPPESWGKTEFTIVQNKESAKRAALESPNGPAAKVPKPLLSTPRAPPSLMQTNASMPFMANHGPAMNGFNGSVEFQNEEFGPQNMDFGLGMGVGPGLGPNPPSAFPLHCDLCQVSMNSQNQAQLHFDGRRHHEAISQHLGRGMPALGHGPVGAGPPSIFQPPAPGHMMGGGGPGIMAPNDPTFFPGNNFANGKPMRGGMGMRGGASMRRGNLIMQGAGVGGSRGGGRGRSFVAVRGRGSSFQKPAARGGRGSPPKRGAARGGFRGAGANNQSSVADDLGGFQRF